MNLLPKIEQLSEKKLIGLQETMSLTNNTTGALWRRFGPRIKEIGHRVSEDKFSLQVYGSGYYQNFDPASPFVKWAAVEVNTFEELPAGLETFLLPAGLYAVFNYRGSSADPSVFTYIFREWLPKSCYRIAYRPHFEVLGANYRNNDPESEEEIWVPIVEG